MRFEIQFQILLKNRQWLVNLIRPLLGRFTRSSYTHTHTHTHTNVNRVDSPRRAMPLVIGTLLNKFRTIMSHSSSLLLTQLQHISKVWVIRCWRECCESNPIWWLFSFYSVKSPVFVDGIFKMFVNFRIIRDVKVWFCPILIKYKFLLFDFFCNFNKDTKEAKLQQIQSDKFHIYFAKLCYKWPVIYDPSFRPSCIKEHIQFDLLKMKSNKTWNFCNFLFNNKLTKSVMSYIVTCAGGLLTELDNWMWIFSFFLLICTSKIDFISVLKLYKFFKALQNYCTHNRRFQYIGSLFGHFCFGDIPGKIYYDTAVWKTSTLTHHPAVSFIFAVNAIFNPITPGVLIDTFTVVTNVTFRCVT